MINIENGRFKVINVSYIPSFNGAAIFIGVSWLLSEDCASVSSVKLSLPFLLCTECSGAKVVKLT